MGHGRDFPLGPRTTATPGLVRVFGRNGLCLGWAAVDDKGDARIYSPCGTGESARVTCGFCVSIRREHAHLWPTREENSAAVEDQHSIIRIRSGLRVDDQVDTGENVYSVQEMGAVEEHAGESVGDDL